MNLPLNFQCEECGRIARAIRDAGRADGERLRARMERVAESSGRDLSHLRLGWVRSIASMPDDEMTTLLQSHYPELAKAQRRRDEHELATGHSVRLHGWWAMR